MELELSLSSKPLPEDFNSLFMNINTLLLCSQQQKPHLNSPRVHERNPIPNFLSTSLSSHIQWLNPSSSTASFPPSRSLHRSLPLIDRALIGSSAGAIAGAFTYVCLLPIDAIKTKLQTRGAAELYSGALDAALQTFRTQGLLGFYRGFSAVLIGSASSSAVYFGTCEFGKSLLSKLSVYPPFLIPPTAGALGNIVSSAIMVPKELITQRMQTRTAGRTWDVLLQILEKDGFMGLYAGYSATLLRNLPTGILSYSSFEYLKNLVLNRTGNAYLEPTQSIFCGALAGGISALLTTPLDVVKTRLMTQTSGEATKNIMEIIRQILMEEGWAGMVRGIGARVFHSACFSAIGYFSFETARLAILHQYVKHREKPVVDDAVD